MVIRNGNQVIRIGGNGISVSGGGTNVQMDGMAIRIHQHGQRIMMDDRGIHIKNETTFNPRQEFQYRGYYDEDESFYGEDQSGFTYNEDTNMMEEEDTNMEEEEVDTFEQDSFDDREEEGGYDFSYSQQSYEDSWSQNFHFPSQYFQASRPFQEEVKQEEPKLTQKQIEKLPLSVYTEAKATKPNNLYFSRNREAATNSSSKFSLSQKLKEQTQPTSSQICAVCIVDYKKGDLQRKLSCDHKFHKECIDKWLLIKNNCPVCKTKAIEV